MPVAIIIIGVGTADFSNLRELDGDDRLLVDDWGNTVHRDCVNFIEYKDAIRRGNIPQQILKEIPEQVCGYMRSVNYELEVPKQEESKEEEDDGDVGDGGNEEEK